MKIETALKIRSNIALSKKTVVHAIYTGDIVLNRINAVLKPYNLTSQQYNVLRILRGQKGNPVSLSEIQERMINRNSNTTRLIDKLVDKNFVSRVVDESNRRKLRISITQKGLDELKRIEPHLDAMEEKTTRQLTKDEMTTLNKLLEKLRA